MTEDTKKESGVKPVGNSNAVKEVPLKKSMRYMGAVRDKGFPIVLSDKRRARLAIKGYV